MAKLCAVPSHIKLPEPDYKNFDLEKEQANEQAYIESLRSWLKDNKFTHPLSGKTIAFGVADGHAQYMIASEKPLQLFHLAFGDAYQISAAHVRGLTLNDVRRMVKADSFFDNLQDENQAFLQKQPVGAILHYDNSGGQEWVRMEVVLHEGKKKLKDIALVGKWGSHDLPFRQDDGTVYCPYHADKVIKGELHEGLQTSTIFEHPDYQKNLNEFKKKNGTDPRKLQPINLTLPPLTPDQKEAARLWKLIESIKETLDKDEAGQDRLNSQTPRQRLQRALAALKKEFHE